MIKPGYVGKVRDVYDLGDKLILASSDRVSAFDVVFKETVPGKGIVLNSISNLWFRHFSNFKNHIIEIDSSKFPEPFASDPYFKDRSVLVHKCERIDFECVVRGYISGSAFKEYKKSGTIAEIQMPANLKESEKLSELMFTPAVKNDSGHDENISEKEMKNRIGSEIFEKLKTTSFALYDSAAKVMEKSGILLCDTKFEFGILNGEIIIIDELLTPDSSRYWDKNSYSTGISPPSFDKQILRNYLETLDWDKNPPAPSLPESLLIELSLKYKQIQELIESCLSQKSI